MSKSKPKYLREKLLKSKALAAYQPDFAAAILTEEEYTLDDAISALDAALSAPIDPVNVSAVIPAEEGAE